MQDKTDNPANPSELNREQLFRLVVESATDFAIITLDADGVVSSWNIGAERLLGYAEVEILGTGGEVIFTDADRAAGIPEAEMTTARDCGRAEDERWHLRKDGSLFWGSGLMMPLGYGAGGFVKIMRDQTARRLAEGRLAASEHRFRTLSTNLPQLVFRCRDTGERQWVSPQWEAYTGLAEEASRDFGWLEAIHPEDREPTIAAWTRAREEGSYAIEHRIRSARGEFRWHQTRAVPTPNDGEGAVEWVGTSGDIQQMRGLQDRQQVLLAELQHRTRNLLAVVHALARQTLRGSTSLDAFATEFEGRLAALSRVQTLVASTDVDRISLRGLLEAELAAHGAVGSTSVRIAGPDVMLPTAAVQTLALALHELATNAVKYGAIGQPQGQLDVSWRMEELAAGPRQLVLEWAETGVAMPDIAAARKGYGSELIERALPYQLQAETRLDFRDDGVHCMIAVPLCSDLDDGPDLNDG